jgi:hypothetical protein
MRQQIAVLVDGAANTVPNRRDRILQPRRAIDDEELGPPQATLDEIVDRAPSLWRLKHRPVADSLQEAGDRLFTFTRLPLEPQFRACKQPMPGATAAMHPRPDHGESPTRDRASSMD